jgi:hypothetical protein
MDLGNSLLWNVGVKMTIRGVKDPDNGRFRFKRIRHSVPATTRILVAVGTSKAGEYWKYGGECQIFFPASPSSTSSFVGGMIVEKKNLTLAKLELFDLAHLPPASYAIEIKPPHWFSDVYIESWWSDLTV